MNWVIIVLAVLFLIFIADQVNLARKRKEKKRRKKEKKREAKKNMKAEVEAELDAEGAAEAAESKEPEETPQDLTADLISALTNLGYKKTQAKAAAAKAFKECPGGSFEALLKLALKGVLKAGSESK